MAIIIKTPGEVEAMKAAGRLSAMVLREVGAHCKPGVSTLELDEIAETFIREHGGVPAFKGYGGFPGSICASVNEQIIHGIPSKDVVLQGGDIISIDTGAIVDGWVGDNAWTFAVGTVSPQKKRLLEVGEKCMWAGIEAAQVGNRLGDVGHAIQSVAEAAGYGVVREYVGHGIGRSMHEEPNVPNYGTTGTGETYNVGWKISPDIDDMRDYYSYSFWVYNTWHEPLMLRASYHYSTGVNYPAQGSEEIELKANDWTYVEVTTDHLLENGVNPKNFNWLSVSVWVPRTQSCSFYFDAIYLNKTPSEHKDFQ